MPVFSRVRDGILVLTVDGDYTANELRRVGLSAFEANSTPQRIPVLLDLSGAVGLARKSPADIADTGAIFAGYRDRLTGIAVVAAQDVLHLFDERSGFASATGVKVQACSSHADARGWLLGA
jgi:hypothetical protein